RPALGRSNDPGISLGPSLMAARGFAAPEVGYAYARARELCQQIGETPQLFPVLYGLYRFYLLRAELHTARELGERLLTLAQPQQDSALLLSAHRALGDALFWPGDCPGNLGSDTEVRTAMKPATYEA